MNHSNQNKICCDYLFESAMGIYDSFCLSIKLCVIRCVSCFISFEINLEYLKVNNDFAARLSKLIRTINTTAQYVQFEYGVGLMFSALVSGSSGLGSTLWPARNIVLCSLARNFTSECFSPPRCINGSRRI